jgi:hypothetical protein
MLWWVVGAGIGLFFSPLLIPFFPRRYI